MSSDRPFRVLSDPRDLLMQERAARGARIDKLGVDRSRHAMAPTFTWSVEAQSREPRFAALRADVTLTERMQAWRGLFARMR